MNLSNHRYLLHWGPYKGTLTVAPDVYDAYRLLLLSALSTTLDAASSGVSSSSAVLLRECTVDALYLSFLFIMALWRTFSVGYACLSSICQWRIERCVQLVPRCHLAACPATWALRSASFQKCKPDPTCKSPRTPPLCRFRAYSRTLLGNRSWSLSALATYFL